MRRLLLLLLALPLVLVPGRTTLAPWTDPAPPRTTSTLSALSLVAPTLSCATRGILTLTVADVTWSPSTFPAPLSYSAVIVQAPGLNLSVTANSLTTVSPSLLSTLLGSWVTLRVTGTLPGTAWTTSSDIQLYVGLAGLSVSCP